MYKLDTDTGEMDLQGGEDDGFNPTYLALSPDGRFLYAADEVLDKAMISAYRINPMSGRLDFINRGNYPGSSLCNLNISADGRALFGANYNSGSTISVRVNGDGSVGELISSIAHRGGSIHPKRQTRPYAHCAMPDRTGKHLVCCDLGADQLLSYRIEPETGLLNLTGVTRTPPGEGPRHLVFDRAGKRAFVVTELGNKVICYDYDAQRGALTQRQLLDVLPEDATGECAGADIHLSPDEMRLFASIRDLRDIGADGVACFAKDGEGWKRDGFITTKRIPRGFDVTPDGRLLVVCCQESNCVQVFDIENRERLCEASVPMPVCVKFGKTGLRRKREGILKGLVP